MSVNKVILVGYLGKDPLVRYLENDRVVAHFTLATNEVFKSQTGERKIETEWHEIEMWGQLAKIAEQHLKKGQQIYLEGKIKSEIWRDKEGKEHSGKRIRVNSFTMLGAKSENIEESVKKPNIEELNEPSDLGDNLPF